MKNITGFSHSLYSKVQVRVYVLFSQQSKIEFKEIQDKSRRMRLSIIAGKDLAFHLLSMKHRGYSAIEKDRSRLKTITDWVFAKP